MAAMIESMGTMPSMTSLDSLDRLPSLTSQDTMLSMEQGSLTSLTLEKPEDPRLSNYLSGWPLFFATLSLCAAVFLAVLEVSIVSTSLVAITDDLDGFSQSSWIVTAYLLTYTGFLIIWAKSSDIFGRKLLINIAVGIFTVFSGACGAAQTITQLIIFRAIQGIGGAGTYSLVIVILFELVPPPKFANNTAMISAVFALGLVLGPLVGGVINQYTTWRWVFLLNLPAGGLTILGLMLTIPNNFPNHGIPESIYKPLSMRENFSKQQLSRIDFPGTTLLLAATILLVAALEEAGSQYSYASAVIIVLLIVSAIAWFSFGAWSWYVTRQNGVREPVFPWRFMQSRIRIGMILSIFLAGAPFTVAVILIPLRFQNVNNLSPLDAGIRLLPYAVANPVGSVLAPVLAGRFKIPPIYMLFIGALIQIAGFSLLSIAPDSLSPAPAQYGYEVLAGFGTGINLASLIVMTPFTVEKRDKSVALSAMIQFRTLGGAVGLAIVTTVMNSYIKSRLADVLSPDQVDSVLRSTENIARLPPVLGEAARQVYAHASNVQLQIMIGFCAAQIPAAGLLWQRKQIKV